MTERELLETTMDIAYRYGRHYGELVQINKQLDADKYNLEGKLEHLKTENKSLRNKYEKEQA